MGSRSEQYVKAKLQREASVMASKHRNEELKRKVFEAADLGSVKLMRMLLHSLAEPSLDGQSKSQKREARRLEKRSRRGKEREESRRGSNGKRKEVEEGSSSGEEDEGLGTREEKGRDRKRSRREEEGESSKRNARQEGSGAEDGHATDDESVSSNNGGRQGKQSKSGSSMERDAKEVKHRRSGHKRSAHGEAVRNIVNCRDADGLSPLHYACYASSEKLVSYLISKGANVHARNFKGDTALHIAANLGPASLISILEDADADMEAMNNEGVTPSDILRRNEENEERARSYKNQEKWSSHLADEVSESEDMWWGTGWDEEYQYEGPDWDPRLEKMAESRQGRSFYDSPFNLRDFLKTEKGKSQGQQESRSKRKGRRTDTASKDEARKSSEVIGPKVKVSVEAQSYSQRWKTFSESYNLCLSYSSVPFPVEEGNEGKLGEVLLEGINPAMHRDALRREMLKWHPDKFLQRFGTKLQGPDHDRIVARVNGISAAIHQLYKNLPPGN